MGHAVNGIDDGRVKGRRQGMGAGVALDRAPAGLLSGVWAGAAAAGGPRWRSESDRRSLIGGPGPARAARDTVHRNVWMTAQRTGATKSSLLPAPCFSQALLHRPHPEFIGPEMVRRVRA